MGIRGKCEGEEEKELNQQVPTTDTLFLDQVMLTSV